MSSPHYSGDPSVVWKEEDGRSILKPRGLSIFWGNDKRYWRIPRPNQDGPAVLIDVCSLEVGASKTIDPKKSYEVGFNVSLKNKWSRNTPIFIMAKRGANGNLVARRVYFEGYELNKRFDIPGNFVIKFLRGDSSEHVIYIYLYDHWTSHWKKDLLIHYAFVKEVTGGNEQK